MLLDEATTKVWNGSEVGGEIREYLHLFFERRWLIASVVATVVSFTLLLTFLATPMFTAETLLRIERTDPKVIDIESVEGEVIQVGAAGDYYNTQYALLVSRSLAERVLDELSIRKSALFLAKPASGPQETAPTDEPEGTDLLIDRYLRQLAVEPVADSRLLRLRFTATDPELAARVVNAHALAYIRDGMEVRARASLAAGSFLRESLDDLRRRVEEAQVALGEFRRKHDIVSVDDKADVVIDRLEDINKRLSAAQSERIAREADMKMVRQRSYESLPAVIQSELIRTLKQELAPVEREYTAQRALVTSSYSGGLELLRTRMEKAQRRIDTEIGNIVSGIESDYLAARQREADIGLQLRREKHDALRVKDDSVRYVLLHQDVESALTLYDSVRQRSEETTMLGALPASNVSVVDAARPREKPSSPRKTQILVLGALLGLCGGLGLALGLDLCGGRLGSEREVLRQLRLATLGNVPTFASGARARKRWLRSARRSAGLHALGDAGEDAAHGRPPEAVQDRYRALRSAVLLSRPQDPPRTLLVCAVREGDGGTTTALNLAVAFSQLGAPSLLIDADLRRPRSHELLRAPLAPGLAEMLDGAPSEVRAIQLGGPPFFFLSAGSALRNASDLLTSARLPETLGKMREQFEYIVLDGPALDAKPDSIVLATRVDAVLLVVDAQRTPRAVAKAACEKLLGVRAPLLGIVLNRTLEPRGATSTDHR